MVFFLRQRAFGPKIMKILFELPAIFRPGKHPIHMGIGQAEAIAIRCGHYLSVPTPGTFEQAAPSRGRIGDNSGVTF